MKIWFFRKPDLRRPYNHAPEGLPAACRFPVGKALDMERLLSVVDNPRDSIWREDYCKWRCEVLNSKCPVAADYFYYRIANVCGNGYTFRCSAAAQ